MVGRGVDLVVAGLKTFNSYGPGQAPEPTPWDVNFGMFSQVMPFWTTRVHPVWVQMEQSTWVRSVLPGLGYDRVRLLELTFPPPLPDNGRAARQFDKARQALDGRRYGDCIRECRGLLNMWEQQFKSTKVRRVADIVAGDRRWPAGDIRRDLLDALWKARTGPNGARRRIQPAAVSRQARNMVSGITMAAAQRRQAISRGPLCLRVICQP